ncbi:MAG: hypothetical protein K6T65_09870 [Peptococcaceae bacterium]|nr:hypothetical protein [Peptococcaceae bacterium]
MADIDTKGLAVAPLNKSQLDKLLEAERTINNDAGTGEVYLLAVTRKG